MKDGDKKVLAYVKWKMLALNHSSMGELANEFNVSRRTMYNWAKMPITIEGVRYNNWAEALEGETREEREKIEKELDSLYSDRYKLSDIFATKVLMAAVLKASKKDYKPTIDEIKMALSIQEKNKDRDNDTDEKSDANKSMTFNIGFRTDKVGDTVE